MSHPAAPLVCLIRDEPPLRYFANCVHEAHGVALVVVERPPISQASVVTKALRTVRTRGVRELLRALEEKRRAHRAEHEAVLGRHFGTAWRGLAPELPVLETPSVNDARVVSRLREIGPVVVLDHGTGIVGPQVLAEASLALNLHWGLSPYYRGTRCTQWALINWDPFNIGVTVHDLTPEIDGGAVVGQARAEVRPDDTAHSIDMQLTRLGTEIVVEAVGRIKAGNELPRVEQDFSQGFLAYGRQWSADLARHAAGLERTGAIAAMLETPARRARLPIVEL